VNQRVAERANEQHAVTPHRRRPTSSAVLVYVIVLVALQLFLVTVAAEAFLSDDEGLAWATATISVVMFGAAAVFLRYLRP
jgi:hypothetical protein